MAQLMSVRLSKGDAASWGFRLQGGKDFGTALVVQKVNVGSPAEKAGLIAGDSVVKVNNVDVYNLRHKEAQDVIIRAGPAFEVTVQRGGSTWKPSVTPTGGLSSPQAFSPVNNISPVTKTSLAASKQDSFGAVGTGHNVSAKPFNAPQVNGTPNGVPKLVNKQYNSPVGLYSEQSIAETLSAQAEVLSTGVLGVNFKKNEKTYDASNSAVFRMVQEADKEPKDLEPEQDTSSVGVFSPPLPSGQAGLRHVIAPENKAAPPTPQLPPGQNICAECERLIVGVFVRIKDKNLHVECFKCATCGSSLKNVGYYNINNKLYCDVHAKLAAKNNTSAPNLVPVTVSPVGRAPLGTISAALASHSAPAPQSPSSNSFAAPYLPSEEPIVSAPIPKFKDNNILKLVKDLNLAAARKREENPEKFVTEKVIQINPSNSNGVQLTNAAPLPFSKFVKKAGVNHSSPRPFSSVSAPLSPSQPAAFPKPAPVSSALAPAEHACETNITLEPKEVAPTPIYNQINITIPLPNFGSENSSPQSTSSSMRSYSPPYVENARENLAEIKTFSPQYSVNGHQEEMPMVRNAQENLHSEIKSTAPKIALNGDSKFNQNSASLTKEFNGTNIHDANALSEAGLAEGVTPVCNQCNIKITRGPFVTALGKIWCPDHFICATPSCRRPLHDLGFVEENGGLYCEYCFEKYLAPPCSKCGIKVKGDCLKAIGKNFHPECFNCAYCGKLFGNNPFFLEDGQPYCDTDWNELFTTKCFACGFPVEAGDRWVEALNNNYHSQCFNCTMCKKNLEGQSFFAKGGRPFCKNHAR